MVHVVKSTRTLGAPSHIFWFGRFAGETSNEEMIASRQIDVSAEVCLQKAKTLVGSACRKICQLNSV